MDWDQVKVLEEAEVDISNKQLGLKLKLPLNQQINWAYFKVENI